jgi:hypothetical protein
VLASFNTHWGSGGLEERKTRGPRNRQVGLQTAHILAAALDPRTKSLKLCIPKEYHDDVWTELVENVDSYYWTLMSAGDSSNRIHVVSKEPTQSSGNAKKRTFQLTQLLSEFCSDSEDDESEKNSENAANNRAALKQDIEREINAYRRCEIINKDNIDPLAW